MNTLASSLKAPLTGGVRFAPSPTGRFHLGNLRTAWISYQWAKTLNLPWVVRVEDIDQPRVLAGAREQQLEDMRMLGLEPSVLLLQTDFHDRHWNLFLKGIESGRLYACDCSRKEVQTALASLASAPHDGVAPVYSGHCRSLGKRDMKAAGSIAWRFRMSNDVGTDDFIIARTGPTVNTQGFPDPMTFVPSYHWACAIDDFDGGYGLLVRSSDLRPAAHVQYAIHDWLGEFEENRPLPAIFHTSLVVQNDGHRLEKRTKGVTLPEVLATGRRIEDVMAKFASSFDLTSLRTPLSPASLLGERKESLTLAELGF